MELHFYIVDDIDFSVVGLKENFDAGCRYML